MSCSFIILNYNDSPMTLELVNRIKNYNNVDNIIVVDNCSKKSMYKVLRDNKTSEWDLIRLKKNMGYAIGNNYGVKYAKKKYDDDIIAISNPDVIFDEAFVELILNGFDKTDYSVLTGLQHTVEGDVYKNAFWNSRSILSIYWDVISKHPLFLKVYNIIKSPKENVDICKKGNLIDVDVVGGCLFFIRAKEFYDIGGFDKNTFLFFEEDIISEKLKNRSKKIGVIRDAKFIHLESHSIDNNIKSKNKMGYYFDSEKYYFRKYISNNILLNLILGLLIKIYWIEKRIIREK